MMELAFLGESVLFSVDQNLVLGREWVALRLIARLEEGLGVGKLAVLVKLGIGYVWIVGCWKL